MNRQAAENAKKNPQICQKQICENLRNLRMKLESQSVGFFPRLGVLRVLAVQSLAAYMRDLTLCRLRRADSLDRPCRASAKFLGCLD
jgi:hypothetical protein